VGLTGGRGAGGWGARGVAGGGVRGKRRGPVGIAPDRFVLEHRQVLAQRRVVRSGQGIAQLGELLLELLVVQGRGEARLNLHGEDVALDDPREPARGRGIWLSCDQASDGPVAHRLLKSQQTGTVVSVGRLKRRETSGLHDRIGGGSDALGNVVIVSVHGSSTNLGS
jgi:hypothetical protein